MKTKHIEVHMQCQVNVSSDAQCGLVAAITCDKTDPYCDRALTKADDLWTCGALYNDGRIIDDYADPFQCLQGDDDPTYGHYPFVSGMTTAADWIWNDYGIWETSDVIYVSCKYDFAQFA